MTIEQVSVQGNTTYFQLFPDASSVFGGDFKKHSQFFLPLATVDLSYFNSSWHGPIPIVTPFEPYDGLIGENYPEYHTYLNRTNWVSYHLSEGKVEFSGDWRIFCAEEYSEYYSAVEAGFKKARDYFNENGCLRFYSPEKIRRGKKREEKYGKKELTLGLIGGFSCDGNWASLGGFPLSSHEQWMDITGRKRAIVSPLTEDGRKFEYIGFFHMSSFINGEGQARSALAGTLSVFYDPQESIVLTTFEWT